jgi:hypothetical protein
MMMKNVQQQQLKKKRVRVRMINEIHDLEPLNIVSVANGATCRMSALS